MATDIEAVEALRHPALAGAAHGFLGRRGGVSGGVSGGTSGGAVAGLDMGSRGMDPADPRMIPVAENRRLGVAAVLPGARLVTVYQVHSPDCVVAGEWGEADRPHADALVSDRPGLLLGILTADCAPVLFHDPRAGVIGAAHAGWRGAFGGVTERTVAAMEALGARREDIAAVVGPCIAQPSYEVDEGFRDRFLAADDGSTRFFAPGRPQHWQFDLPGYVVARLRQGGVGTVAALDEDTCAQPERFFSYRRSTLAGEADYGRQISLIGLPG